MKSKSSDNKGILLINTNLMKTPIALVGLDYIGGTLINSGFDVEMLDFL